MSPNPSPPESSQTLQPELAPADVLHFAEHHRPGLLDGDYRLEVKQEVAGDRSVAGTFHAVQELSVLGDRFELTPGAVHAMFPPPRSRGAFATVLPHVLLNRSTLPWERTAELGDTDVATAPPWLALLVFDEEEIQKIAAPEDKGKDPQLAGGLGQVVKLGEIKAGAADPYFPAVREEAGQHDEDRVTVLDVDRGLLETILPRGEDLPYLAHVRRVDHQDPKLADVELAVVVAHRLPRSGRRNVVHLVSLEERYQSRGGRLVFDAGGAPARVRLVSLQSWDFFCQKEKETFKELIEHLNGRPSQPETNAPDADPDPWNRDSATFRLPLPEPQKDAGAASPLLAASCLQAGFVPLPHRLRTGDRTVSWYHGPLVPAEPVRAGNGSGEADVLPAATADELVIFDPASGLFDVSYAAAWELGRMLTLENRRVALRQLQWKRLHAQELRRAEQRAGEAFHLPLREPAAEPAAPEAGMTAGDPLDLPPEVRGWLDDLTCLRHVPFGYLVPDDRLLPPESLRFFELDRLWLECLRDGAFSIGRVLAGDRRGDAGHSGRLTPLPRVTGMILRSRVVTGFPGLLVDAYDGNPSPGKVNVNTATEEQLAFKPGVGPELAKRIVRYRDEQRRKNPQVMPFQKPEDLAQVKGIGPKTLQAMLPCITVSGATTLTAPYGEVPRPSKLPRLRPPERLGRDVLICLFLGQVHTVDLHLRPETLHFGFDGDDHDVQKLVKKLRRSDGRQIQKTVEKLSLDAATRVLRPADLAAEIGRVLGTDLPGMEARTEAGTKKVATAASGPLNPGIYSLEMVAGVELVRFFRGGQP
jgi:competence ComEA-like helix-hairpin-helix protein